MILDYKNEDKDTTKPEKNRFPTRIHGTFTILNFWIRMDSYKPIDCNLYDVYIRYIIDKKKVSVINLTNPHETITGRILDIFTQDGKEYLKMEDGIIKRLDQIEVKVVGEEE